MTHSPIVALIDRSAQRPAYADVRTDHVGNAVNVMTVPLPFGDGALGRLDLQADGQGWLIFSAAVPTIFTDQPPVTEIRDLEHTELRHPRDIAADLAGDPLAAAHAVVDWFIDDILSARPLDRDPEPLLREVRLALIDSARRSTRIGFDAGIRLIAAHRRLDGKLTPAGWHAECLRAGERLAAILDDAVARLPPTGWTVEFHRGRVYRHPITMRVDLTEASGHERLAAAAQSDRALRRIRGA